MGKTSGRRTVSMKDVVVRRAGIEAVAWRRPDIKINYPDH